MPCPLYSVNQELSTVSEVFILLYSLTFTNKLATCQPATTHLEGSWNVSILQNQKVVEFNSRIDFRKAVWKHGK